jgi:hypothetical protein
LTDALIEDIQNKANTDYSNKTKESTAAKTAAVHGFHPGYRSSSATTGSSDTARKADVMFCPECDAVGRGAAGPVARPDSLALDMEE